jgi:hypothetical protein
VKKIIREGKEYLEVPGDLRGKKIVALRLDNGLYVVGTDEKIKQLVKKQVTYLVGRKGMKREQKQRTESRTRASDRGFWIFDSEAEASRFSYLHAAEFHSGRIKGIRGFDGRFYAIRDWVYSKYLPLVINYLRSKPGTVKEIAKALKVEEGLVKVILELAREEGLVVERSGGVYEYAG